MVNVFTALKKSKELFEAEMAELGSQRDMQTKESEAMAKISGLEKKIQFSVIEQVWDLFQFAF